MSGNAIDQSTKLTGVNYYWVKVKQTDSIYITLKVVSCILAGTFATLTLFKKPMLQDYGTDYPLATNKF